MHALTYIYPMFAQLAFTEISKQHIKYLRNYATVYEVDEQALDSLVSAPLWRSGQKALLHPILYPLMGDKPEHYPQRIRRLGALRNICDRLGGFEVADSDKISEKAVEILNQMDVVIVPSNFVKSVFRSSGVSTKIHVLPHGVPPEFFAWNPRRGWFKKIYSLKYQRGYKYVLYFLTHSGYRKGADLVARAIADVQARNDKIVLLLKYGKNLDPYMRLFTRLKTITIGGWLDVYTLAHVYKLADIVVCPSRGGGFELNAFEAICMGIPTIVPEKGPFEDYKNYAITVKCERKVRVLPNNPIHVGEGWEVSVRDLTDKILQVAANLKSYKAKFAERALELRKKYMWPEVVKQLAKILNHEGFIECG